MNAATRETNPTLRAQRKKYGNSRTTRDILRRMELGFKKRKLR